MKHSLIPALLRDIKIKINIFLLSIVISSCGKEEELNYYNSKFYPVHRTTYTWEKNSFFNNQLISIRLESRIDFEDRSWQGRFEPILENVTELFLDRELIVGDDTINKTSNLLEYGIAEIELYKVTLNRDSVPDSYIFWINKQNLQDYKKNKGYYTVYLKTKTQNNYQINDSTIIYLE